MPEIQMDIKIERNKRICKIDEDILHGTSLLFCFLCIKHDKKTGKNPFLSLFLHSASVLARYPEIASVAQALDVLDDIARIGGEDILHPLDQTGDQVSYTIPDGNVTIYADFIPVVWDGTVDLTWYDKDADLYQIRYPAQLAGIYAIDEKNYIKDTVKYISQEREYLSQNLKKLNIKVFDSDVNYLLLKTDIPLYDMLLKEKILIRKCGNYCGLDDNFYRIAVRTHGENQYLLNKLKGGLSCISQ